MFEGLRQLNYPASFRIDDPGWPNIDKLIDLISELCTADESRDPSPNQESHKLLGDIGTVIWRLGKRSKTEIDPAEKVRRMNRDVEAAADFIRQGDLEIKDHTGELYDGGMRIKVIEFQKMEGLNRDRIVETVKPTIYYKGKLLQLGEVIVGTP